MPAVELRDLIHYPFLPEAQKVLASRGISVASLAKSTSGQQYLDKACSRVMYAIDGKNQYPEDTSGDNISDIVTYVLARILVSCIKDRMTIQRFVRAESKRVYSYLSIEQNKTLKQRVCQEFGISDDAEELTVLQYVEMAASITDSKWRLINRKVQNGIVEISPDELEILLSEKIRAHLSSSLPLSVPESLAQSFQPWVDKISARVQERTLEEFGTIEETAFPPCIQTLIEAAAAGANIAHAGRFALVAFLHTIGMPAAQIESIFARSPNYNPEMTEYQVNHILTNEYTPPSCLTMQTHGVCSHKVALCEKMPHPLSYYREMKRLAERKKQQEARRLAKLAEKKQAAETATAENTSADKTVAEKK
ncbi:MAG TPA: DNA primase large subunit PriL [Methanocorpusculum sp.]|nr:DNA primase large subunit PriL [Methanocorpusculum sp.]